MKNNHIISVSALAMAMLAGCSTLPADNSVLEVARRDYAAALNNQRTVDLAGVELKEAGDALQKANDAWSRKDSTAEVDHLAYLAKQRVAIAQEITKQRTAEIAVTNANAVRERIQLGARTREADAAQRSAEHAQRQSEMLRRHAEASQRQAEESQRQSSVAQQQARDAEFRTQQLESQIKDLNAKKTDRGLVITLGDVLFDTGKAQLKSGDERSVGKLVAFLNQYPQRKVVIEGFTDSTGSEPFNLALSARRSKAVRTALMDMGVSGERIAMYGFGEAYPVADNDTQAGRQLNRRVEVIISDDNGNITPR